MSNKTIKDLFVEEIQKIDNEDDRIQLELSFELLQDVYNGIGFTIEALEDAEDALTIKSLNTELIRKATMFDNIADAINLVIGKDIIDKFL